MGSGRLLSGATDMFSGRVEKVLSRSINFDCKKYWSLNLKVIMKNPGMRGNIIGMCDDMLNIWIPKLEFDSLGWHHNARLANGTWIKKAIMSKPLFSIRMRRRPKKWWEAEFINAVQYT